MAELRIFFQINSMISDVFYKILWGKNLFVCKVSDGPHLKKEIMKIKKVSAATAKSLQSCPTLCDPIDRSPQGSSIPGILQARILEWVAISFSKHACMLSHFSCVHSVQSHGQQPTRLLCPGGSPSKNTGVGCYFLLAISN